MSVRNAVVDEFISDYERNAMGHQIAYFYLKVLITCVGDLGQQLFNIISSLETPPMKWFASWVRNQKLPQRQHRGTQLYVPTLHSDGQALAPLTHEEMEVLGWSTRLAVSLQHIIVP